MEFSGREGLWGPDIAGCVVSNNIFRENGRKNDAGEDCEIRLDETERCETKTGGIRIEGNLFYTTETQSAAIYLSDGVESIDMRNNSFQGSAPELKGEGDWNNGQTQPNGANERDEERNIVQ